MNPTASPRPDTIDRPRRAQAPADSGQVVLGRTLPALLEEALAANPNPAAFNQRRGDGWRSLSTSDFLDRADRLAAGLLELGVEAGERVVFYTHSDLSFIVADMACLSLGLVDVPIYLTHAHGAVDHILAETEARLLVVSDGELLEAFRPRLEGSRIETVIIAEPPAEAPSLPAGMELLSFAQLEDRGRAELERDARRVASRREALDAEALATIIYTSGTTGTPKGVMLSHQNISSNVIAAFTGLKTLMRGPEEVALSFLPLSHVFARTLQYGYMWYGTTVYFSDPDTLRDDLRELRPTVFAAVPRVLEKAFERILAVGGELTGVRRGMFDWSLALARRYRVEAPPHGIEALELALADRLVLSKWRSALGGRVRHAIIGGAALRPDLVNVFAAAGIRVLQGYGLTESSPVIAFNRPESNRPDTVGPPLAGVEVAIADDGEVLTRGPHVMLGYYRRPEFTAETVVDGWLHTGDRGELTDDGFLRITGRLKNMFKLSTGKYVMPQPIEQALEANGLVEHALVVGEGEKYCAALLFLSEDAVRAFGRREGVSGEPSELLANGGLQTQLRQAVEAANRELPAWSTVKRVLVLMGELSTANALLTPTLKIRRTQILERYRDHVEATYGRGEVGQAVVIAL